MRRQILSWAVVAAVAIPMAARAADWPNFRGLNHDGMAPDTGINKEWAAKAPELLWKAAMGDGGYAGPAAANGMVFIVDHSGTADVVRAIDLRTGSNAWTYSYADNANANYGFARATPAVDQGRVYTMSRLGVLNCLDAKSGAPVWSRNIVTELQGSLPQWQMAVSPFIDGEKLVVCPGGPDASVAALDKATGKTVWKGGGSDKPGYSTPVAATIGGRKQYVVFNGAALVGVDAADGKLLWRLPWKTDYDVNAATPVVAGDTVFITSGYGHGCALVKASAGDASIQWQNKALRAHFNSPILNGGFVYGIGDEGVLVCIELKSGDTVWMQSGFEKGGVACVDGAIVAVDGKDGDVVLAEMNPAKYVELGRFKPLGGQSWTAPVVADGKLLIRNKSALACYRLK